MLPKNLGQLPTLNYDIQKRTFKKITKERAIQTYLEKI